MSNALCIGINDYPGTQNDLSGCVNDAEDWAEWLRSRGLGPTLLLNDQATRANIIKEMKRALSDTMSGHTTIITYSGHGTWVPDQNGDEPDGRDEALCPYDLDEHHLILDDEITAIFAARPKNTKVLFVTDSCHSGTVARMAGLPAVHRRMRFMPPSVFMNASSKVHHMDGMAMTRAMRTDTPLPGVIHFAACQDREYSYDAEFHGRPNGAFSYWALSVLRSAKPNLSYQKLYRGIRDSLPSYDYPQTPKLNASKDLQRLPVLG